MYLLAEIGPFGNFLAIYLTKKTNFWFGINQSSDSVSITMINMKYSMYWRKLLVLTFSLIFWPCDFDSLNWKPYILDHTKWVLWRCIILKLWQCMKHKMCLRLLLSSLVIIMRITDYRLMMARSQILYRPNPYPNPK